MIVKLQTEHHLEFLSFKRGCTDSSESRLVKMPHCLKSHVTAHLSVTDIWMHRLRLRLNTLKTSLTLAMNSECTDNYNG